MENEIDNFYLQKEEPIKGCLIALREIILSQDTEINKVWKYGMPFFCNKGKMFCYLWVHKKHNKQYLGIVEGNRFEHPKLIIEQRSRMKIMPLEPNEDLPIDTIQEILTKAIGFYKTAEIKIR